MSLNKVNYIDNSTIITAKNLNDIQDNIIELQDNLENIKQTLPLGIEYGGTGATNVVDARKNLGITPENIGAMSMELLWENASRESAFAAQTISLSLNTDDFIIIESDEAAGAYRHIFAFCLVGKSSRIFAQSNYRQYRTFKVEIDGITFDDGQEGAPNVNLSKANNRAIPIRIFRMGVSK